MNRRRLAMVVATMLVTTACAPDPPSAAVGIVARGCPPTAVRGSGMVVAPGVVLTAAHTVAGATEIDVIRAGGFEDRATVVGFDPEMDLAYLAVSPTFAHPMPATDTDHVEAGDEALAYVFRDGGIVTLPIEIRRRIRINTEDIYIEGTTSRPGFELGGDIRLGDSGGIVVVDGEVVGVIWARSRRDDARAYAIDPTLAGDLIDEQLRTGTIDAAIDLARCT